MSEQILDKWEEWEEFPELNQVKSFWDKILNVAIGFWSIYANLYNRGYRKVRVIKLLDTKTGKTRIIKENKK